MVEIPTPVQYGIHAAACHGLEHDAKDGVHLLQVKQEAQSVAQHCGSEILVGAMHTTGKIKRCYAHNS